MNAILRSGFLLVDACIALGLAGMLALAAAGVAAHVNAMRVSLEPALEARASGQAALIWLGDQIRQGGAFLPPATVNPQNPMLGALSPALGADSIGTAGDRLTIRHESRTDCLGNARIGGRDYHDPTRKPPTITQTNLIYVSRTATGGPSLMCDPDGPGTATAQAFASQIEAMQLRFWLRGVGGWRVVSAVSAWDTVQAVEVCLVLTGGKLADCPATAGSTVRPLRVLVGVFTLRNAV